MISGFEFNCLKIPASEMKQEHSHSGITKLLFGMGMETPELRECNFHETDQN